MHGMGNQVADAVEHRRGAGRARQACELLGHDPDSEKCPPPACGAGVAGVLGGALSSAQLEGDRRERQPARFLQGGGRGASWLAAAIS